VIKNYFYLLFIYFYVYSFMLGYGRLKTSSFSGATQIIRTIYLFDMSITLFGGVPFLVSRT